MRTAMGMAPGRAGTAMRVILLAAILAALPLAGCVDGFDGSPRRGAIIDNGTLRCYSGPEPRTLLSWTGPEGADALPEAQVETPVEVPPGTLALRLDVTEPAVAGGWRLSLLDPSGVEVWENHRDSTVVGTVNLGDGSVHNVRWGAYTIAWTSSGAVARAATLVVVADICADHEISP